MQLPPLRERGTDVLLLARHYLDRACSEYGLRHQDPRGGRGSRPSGLHLAGQRARAGQPDGAGGAAVRCGAGDGGGLASAARAAHLRGTARAGESVNEQMASLERARIEEALRAEGVEHLPRRRAARPAAEHAALSHGAPRALPRAATPRRHRRSIASRRRAVAAPPSPVRWQRTRVTLLQAQVLDADATAAEHERARVLEDIAAKGQRLRRPDHRAGSRVGEGGVRSRPRRGRGAPRGPRRLCRAARGRRVDSATAQLPCGSPSTPRRCWSAGSRIASSSTPTRGGPLSDVLDGMLADRTGRADPRVGDDQAFPGTAIRRRAARSAPEPRRVVARHRARRRRSPRDARSCRAPARSRVLEDLLTQVEDGRGQAVLLAGDPGIGKTRLLHEFHRRTSGRAAWLQGSAVSFGSSLPFHPLIDLLKHAFSVQASDSDEVIGDRIDRATAAFGEAFRPSVRVPSIAAVDRCRRRVARAARSEASPRRHLRGDRAISPRRLRGAPADRRARGPALDGSGDGRVPRDDGREPGVRPDSVVCDAPDRIHAAVRAGRVRHAADTLQSLAHARRGAIGCSLLGASALSAELQQLIDDKTDGNPFFVEEVLRSLQERGLLERRGDEVGLVRPIGEDRRSRQRPGRAARTPRAARSPRRATCFEWPP